MQNKKKSADLLERICNITYPYKICYKTSDQIFLSYQPI